MLGKLNNVKIDLKIAHSLSRNPEKYLKAILRTKFKKTQGTLLYHSLKIAALSVVNRDIGNSFALAIRDCFGKHSIVAMKMFFGVPSLTCRSLIISLTIKHLTTIIRS